MILTVGIKSILTGDESIQNLQVLSKSYLA